MGETSTSTGQWRNRVLILLTAAAAPMALGFETLIRKLLLPPEFERMRMLLGPVMSTVAWVMVGLALLGAVLGILFQRRLVARALDKIPDAHRTPAHEERAKVGAFLLAANVPQVPAIFATVCFLFGSSLLPVLAVIIIVTIAVSVQAARV